MTIIDHTLDAGTLTAAMKARESAGLFMGDTPERMARDMSGGWSSKGDTHDTIVTTGIYAKQTAMSNRYTEEKATTPQPARPNHEEFPLFYFQSRFQPADADDADNRYVYWPFGD